MTNTVERPKPNCKEVVRLAAEMLLPKVIEWLKEGGDDRAEEERDQILDDLADAIEYEDDGFRIAEQLKSNHYWEPDAGLVEILDRHYKYDAHKSLVKKWVKDNDIKPELELGAKVTVHNALANFIAGKKIDGVITKIELDTAQYIVFSESEGHVRSGVGTYGICVPFEDVERIA